MSTLISNYTRELYRPVLQYRGYQANKYLPRLPIKDKYSVLGEMSQPLIRCAYMTPLKDSTISSGGFTGLKTQKTIINTGCGYLDNATRITVANIGGNLSGSVVLNSRDKAEPDVLYGGMHVSFQTKWNWNHGLPHIDGLCFSVASHRPYYKGWDGNKGGDLAMILNFVTTDAKHRIGMVVRLYGLNKNQWLDHEKIVQFDPNNGKLHVAESLKCENKYLTTANESDYTKVSRGDKTFAARYPHAFGNFFKFKLSNEKFVALLKDTASFDFDKRNRAENWRLEAVIMQYELEETGHAIFGGAHSGLRITQGEK